MLMVMCFIDIFVWFVVNLSVKINVGDVFLIVLINVLLVRLNIYGNCCVMMIVLFICVLLSVCVMFYEGLVGLDLNGLMLVMRMVVMWVFFGYICSDVIIC